MTLLALHEGWIDTLLALQAARQTRVFEIPSAAEPRAARREVRQE